MKHTNCNNNNNKYINNSKQDEWSSAGWSIDSIRLLASKPRFHHPTPRLHRDPYVYTTLFGHHCLIWSCVYPFYHLVPSLSLFDFVSRSTFSLSTMPWILPACILKCF